MSALNNRIMIFVVSLTIIVLLMTSCSRKSKDTRVQELHVYNWNAYIGSNTISNFEKRYSVKVIYDNYSSNDELYAKLKAGATGYDVIFPSDYMVKILINEGLLQPIDLVKISNFKNISKKFAN